MNSPGLSLNAFTLDRSVILRSSPSDRPSLRNTAEILAKWSDPIRLTFNVDKLPLSSFTESTVSFGSNQFPTSVFYILIGIVRARLTQLLRTKNACTAYSMVYSTMVVISLLKQLIDLFIFGDVCPNKRRARTLFTQGLCRVTIGVANDYLSRALS